MRTHALFLGSAAIALFLGVAQSTLAEAHHSGAGFNSDKVIELTGTIKEFQFTNPHTWIQVVVEDNKGAKDRVERRVGQPQFARSPGDPSVNFSAWRQGHDAAATDAQRRSRRCLRRCKVHGWDDGRAMGIALRLHYQ